MESEDERFENLWTDYLEGDLDENGIAMLREMLADDEARSRRVASLYQTHRLLGYLFKESDAASELFVQELLRRLPRDSAGFTEEVMRRQREILSSRAEKEPEKRKFAAAVVWMAAACVVLAAGAWLWSQRAREHGAPAVAGIQPSEVRVTRLARARFFGELAPQIHAALPFDKEYTLISGMLELRFPTGAEAILEAPAVFRVKDRDLLVMDTGTCSVHAPPGAEGFRVETPGSTIVDRGTRFSVKVNESNETEVHVVEGMADVYPVSDGEMDAAPSREIRLTEKQALRMQNFQQPVTAPTAFDSSTYRKQLPDRIISYGAEPGADGHAETLTDVTVQRGGEVMVYPVEELIGAEVVWFKATDDVATDYMITATGDANSSADDPNVPSCATRYDYLLTNPGTRVSPSTLLADRSLLTGVINPGGSPVPLAADPVMARDASSGKEGTPGLAIRFHQPVINGPGPDVVFFELQPVIYPPEGDAFHVSPLHFRKGLRSHTIRNYDLNLHSSEALRVTPPYVHFSENLVAKSLEDLNSMKLLARPMKLVYRAVAVGIDLSDLGYAPGDRVDGLFFQDVMDDQFHVDPVFIGGLPMR